MDSRQSGSPTLVYNAASFSAMLSHLWESKLIALDTESDSLFSYYTKVCLIQISTYSAPPAGADQAQADAIPNTISETSTEPVTGSISESISESISDYLVDPLRFSEIGDLGLLLASPECEVIIHAAENDILLLQREFGFTFNRLFDTQLAARILGWERVGLAAILEEKFGVVSDKRMQRTNWGKRPLTPEQIAYAQMDTHYLPALRALQVEELKSRDRWEEAQEAFQQLARLDYRARPINERSLWSMRETRSVPYEHLGVLEALWLWREQEAQRQDRPPFKIINNQVLAELALAQPTSQGQLSSIRGLGSAEARRYGPALLQTIAEGKRRPPPPLPEPALRPEQFLDRQTLSRFDALRRWRAHMAEQRGVAPDIVLTNDVLLEIVKRLPHTPEELMQIEGIGPWKAQTYGPDILRIIRR